MKISKVIIKNYRNLKNVDICLGDSVILIGENNGGKSNFLKAITLPLLSDDFGTNSKNLSWIDINDEAKEVYYKYIIDNQKEIIDGTIDCANFISNLPVVEVEVQFKPNETEIYYVKDFSYAIEGGEIKYGLKYEFKPSKIEEIYSSIRIILSAEELNETNIKKIKMNLMPVEYYSYYITVPNKGPASYDSLKLYKYTSLEAERDEFSRTKEYLGSKSLVKLLQTGLKNEDKLKVEKEYNNFFEQLKNISDIDKVFNWQDETELKEAKELFEHISILPNMPPMQTIFNSIRLGYSDGEMALQGLGYRNMLLLLVLINSLIKRKDEIALNVFTIEEPEAHLCINNIRIMSSFFKTLTLENTPIQLFYSTHSTEFITKMDLKNIVIIHNGKAFSLMQELEDKERDYLVKNPNMDIFKLFFSKKCILFEGISEEMLLRAHIDSKKELNDIELISFHKGYTKIIEISVDASDGC